MSKTAYGVDNPTTGLVVVARMASSRLPGKSMVDIGGQPSLGWLLTRAGCSCCGRSITVATTTDPSDDAIAKFTAERGVGCYRGSVDDVLGRVHGAVEQAGLDLVVHVTGDCPMMDPGLIDHAVEHFLAAEVDYTILDPDCYPRGLDVEVFWARALAEVERRHSDPWIREHVTEPLYTTPDLFRADRVPCPRELDRRHYRLTIDTSDDYQFVQAVVAQFGGRDDFDARQIVSLLDSRPDLVVINSHVKQVKYKAGIVGLGRIGSEYDAESDDVKSAMTHAGTYLRHGKTQLAAAADCDPSKREEFRLQRQVEAVYASASEMLSAKALDIVSIATPLESHMSVGRMALDAGVRAIFCEKPFAHDLAEGRALAQACREKGVILAVNHWMRWSPQFQAIRGFTADGGLGTIASARVHYSKGLLNSGTHAVDLLRFLFGEVTAVLATEHVSLDTPDDNIGGVLFMQNSLTSYLTVSDYRDHFTFSLDIIGSRGRLVLQGDDLEYWEARDGGALHGAPSLVRAELPFGWEERQAFVCAVDEIVTCLDQQTTDTACTGEDGLRAVEVALALRQSWQNDRARIDLPVT